MKRIRITGISIEFDADQATTGTNIEQARSAMEQINLALQRQPYGMAARVDCWAIKEDNVEEFFLP